MKNFSVLLMLLAFFNVNGQGATCGDVAVHITPTNTNTQRTTQFSMSNTMAQSVSMVGDATNVSKLYNTKSKGVNSQNTLLYDEWDNSGTILTNKGNYAFKRMNFDLQRGIVLVKTDNHEVYTFSTNQFKTLVINEDRYQVSLNSKGTYQLFQIMYQDDDGFKVLKGYELVLKKASPHAMLNMGNATNTIRKKESYYASNANRLVRIKMSNKKINKLIENTDFADLKNTVGKSKNRRMVSKN